MHWFLLLILSCFANDDAEMDKLLRISWRSDLQFGVAVQGDPAKTVTPDGSTFSGAASIEVKGKPHSTYNIILPQNRIPLSNINWDTGAKIYVSDFRASPPEGLNGKLDGNGKQIVFIGATRDAISVQQARGKYSGSFQITAVYP